MHIDFYFEIIFSVRIIATFRAFSIFLSDDVHYLHEPYNSAANALLVILDGYYPSSWIFYWKSWTVTTHEGPSWWALSVKISS